MKMVPFSASLDSPFLVSVDGDPLVQHYLAKGRVVFIGHRHCPHLERVLGEVCSTIYILSKAAYQANEPLYSFDP